MTFWLQKDGHRGNDAVPSTDSEVDAISYLHETVLAVKQTDSVTVYTSWTGSLGQQSS